MRQHTYITDEGERGTDGGKGRNIMRLFILQVFSLKVQLFHGPVNKQRDRALDARNLLLDVL